MGDREKNHKGIAMNFLKKLLRNLAFLIGIGIVLYLASPDLMSQVFELYGAIFGPLVILILVGAAIPNKKS